MDPVEAALGAVSKDFYVLEPGGRPLPQSSNPQVIAAVLRLSEVSSGARVLEIGTGSGFSTALLAHLVGPGGRVTSLEVDAHVADRARRLLTEQGVQNAVVLAANGQFGCPQEAPYDRVIAWASVNRVPQEWVDQVCVDGLIVAPVVLGPLAHANAVVRLRRRRDEGVVGESIISGSFVPLSETPNDKPGGAPDEADIVIDPDGDPAMWISALWLRNALMKADTTQVRELCLRLKVRQETRSLAAADSAEAFRAYLLATLPDELTTAYLGATGRAIGAGTADGLALVSLRDGGLFTSGSDSAVERLTAWIQEWRSLGGPGFSRMLPTIQNDSEGWIVRAALHEPLSA